MSSIKDLQERINSAEAVLSTLKTELEDLKKQEQEQEQESLFGRWATHPENGRGIIVSFTPDADEDLRFAYGTSRYTGHASTCFVRPESLDLDPVPLTTAQDFKDAPEGTIVEATTEPRDVYVNDGKRWWVAGDNVEANPTTMPTCRVIRWGENDQ